MLKDVVLVQKRELENRLQETYVEREISDRLDLGNDLIKVITGGNVNRKLTPCDNPILTPP